MDVDKDVSQTAVLILTGAAGVAIVLWGLSLLVPAIGVAVGLAWSIGATGSAIGVPVAPVVVSAAGYGLAGAGIGCVTYIVVKIAKRAEQEPFQWLVPILGVVNGFLVQVCSDYWVGPKLVWLALSTVSALLVVVGGALYTKESPSLRFLAFTLHLLIPLVVALCITSTDSASIQAAIKEVPFRAWLLIGAMAVVAVAIALLARTLAQSK